MRPTVRLLLLVTLVAGACRTAAPPAPAPPSAIAAEPPAPAAVGALPSPAPARLPGEPTTDLQARVDALGGSGELRLAAGTYLLTAQMQADSACAACPGIEWESQRPAVSVGLRLSGKGLRIVGAGADRTIIRTRSGYGVLFDGCDDCAIEGVTLTDGARDGSDQASDAAIVVRSSSIRVSDCVIADNLGAGPMVERAFVGVSGVVVREGGRAVIERCRITRSSWDGVTVLRGGRAALRDVVIDGVDRPQGRTIGGGRGVGVRIATGGSAVLDGVLVARHAGGLAVYGASKLELRDTVVEESSSWGVLAQADASGAPTLQGDGLVIHRAAACGVAVTGAVTGGLTALRVVRAAEGGAGAGPCAPVALDVEPPFQVTDAASWLTGGRPGMAGDAEGAAFREGSHALAARLAVRPATAESQFVTDRR